MNTTKLENINYFINKFEGIPDEQWCVGFLECNGAKCALGHCGVTTGNPENDSDFGSYILTPEAKKLVELFGSTIDITDINDDDNGGTPKQRILNELKRLKAIYETTK